MSIALNEPVPNPNFPSIPKMMEGLRKFDRTPIELDDRMSTLMTPMLRAHLYPPYVCHPRTRCMNWATSRRVPNKEKFSEHLRF